MKIALIILVSIALVSAKRSKSFLHLKQTAAKHTIKSKVNITTSIKGLTTSIKGEISHLKQAVDLNDLQENSENYVDKKIEPDIAFTSNDETQCDPNIMRQFFQPLREVNVSTLDSMTTALNERSSKASTMLSESNGRLTISNDENENMQNVWSKKKAEYENLLGKIKGEKVIYNKYVKEFNEMKFDAPTDDNLGLQNITDKSSILENIQTHLIHNVESDIDAFSNFIEKRENKREQIILSEKQLKTVSEDLENALQDLERMGNEIAPKNEALRKEFAIAEALLRVTSANQRIWFSWNMCKVIVPEKASMREIDLNDSKYHKQYEGTQGDHKKREIYVDDASWKLEIKKRDEARDEETQADIAHGHSKGHRQKARIQSDFRKALEQATEKVAAAEIRVKDAKAQYITELHEADDLAQANAKTEYDEAVAAVEVANALRLSADQESAKEKYEADKRNILNSYNDALLLCQQKGFKKGITILTQEAKHCEDQEQKKCLNEDRCKYKCDFQNAEIANAFCSTSRSKGSQKKCKEKQKNGDNCCTVHSWKTNGCNPIIDLLLLD